MMMPQLYMGCVENRIDPLKLGRCQVRIVGLHTEDKTKLPTADLPWAYPVQPITSAATSGIGTAPIGPVEGSWLLITFMDKDQQQPIMLGSLGGSFQTQDAMESGEFKTNRVDPDGSIDISDSRTSTPAEKQSAEQASTPSANKEATPGDAQGRDEIVGPLAKLIAKGESGAAGYDAFNRGSGAKPGTGSIGGEKLTLTKMPIKDIMAKQALSPSAPDRLFAVGKYQCIPDTLKAACSALNIDVNCPFNETTQDLICQEYLVGRKRPKLVAYYRNPDKNNDALLKAAGKSLAAEFASIEDPDFPGYPYGGPDGRYAKNGNKVHTPWSLIRNTLQQEWDFRNSSKTPAASTLLAGGDKVDKGTDYYGVAKQTPVDDSTSSAPKDSGGSDSGLGGDLGGFGDLGGLAGAAGLGDLASLQGSIPGLGDISGLTGDLLGNLPSDLLSGLTSQLSSFNELVNSIDLNGSLNDLVGGLGDSVGSILSDFGSSLSEITESLGIPNLSGSVTELVQNLGIAVPSKEALVFELERIAGSPAGQAKALLTKLEVEGEPTIQSVAAIGQKNADGTISTGSAVDPNIGFQDPNGKYPLYKNEQDTNRLATNNNLGRTYVVKKEAAMKMGIKIANGGTWDQPAVPYNAVYPYNKVTQTESGHVQEWDDTPGSERVHFWHKAGSFFEWDSNGTQVNKIVGDGYTIYDRNGNIYVTGACNLTVDGALNVRTDNIMNLEVSGAAKVNIFSNADINVSGSCNLAVGTELNAKAAKVNIESEGQMNLKAGTGLHIQAGKDLHIKSDFAINMEATTDIDQLANGSMILGGKISNHFRGENNYFEATGKNNFKSGGDTNIQAGESVNVKAGTNVNIEASATANILGSASTNVSSGGSLSVMGAAVAVDGGIIELNSGSASSASGAGSADEAIEASPAKNAGQADLELPIETRGTSGNVSLPPLPVIGRGSEVGYDSPSAGNASVYAAKSVSNNSVAKSSIEQPKVAVQTEKPSATSGSSPGTVAGLDAIRAMPADQFTAGMKLSKYFTLGDLTKGGVRIPRVTYNVNGANITPQEIVCNMKVLAEKVLDPIREKLGPFTITSAFRRPPFGGAPGDLGTQKEGGDHPIGCAADIVFTGGKQATFDAAKEIVKILPAWNQVIMEYNGNQYWVHVACKPAGNKGDMFTMNHHKTYAGTFPKGGFVLV